MDLTPWLFPLLPKQINPPIPYFYKGYYVYISRETILIDKIGRHGVVQPIPSEKLVRMVEDCLNENDENLKVLPKTNHHTVTCPFCKGFGLTSYCPECGGKGTVTFENDYNDYEVTCKTCYGREVIHGKDKCCTKCHSTGKIIEEEESLCLLDGILVPKTHLVKLYPLSNKDFITCKRTKLGLYFSTDNDRFRGIMSSKRLNSPST